MNFISIPTMGMDNTPGEHETYLNINNISSVRRYGEQRDNDGALEIRMNNGDVFYISDSKAEIPEGVDEKFILCDDPDFELVKYFSFFLEHRAEAVRGYIHAVWSKQKKDVEELKNNISA